MANTRRIRKTRLSRKSRKQSGAGYSMDVGAAPIGGLTAVRSYSENARPTLAELNATRGTPAPAQSGGAKKRNARKSKRSVRKSRRNVRKSKRVVRKSRKSVRKTRRNRRNARK